MTRSEGPKAYIPCPRCGTRTVVDRSLGPVPFSCAGCGLEGALTGLRIVLTCPKCKTPYDVDGGRSRGKMRCPRCGKEMGPFGRM